MQQFIDYIRGAERDSRSAGVVGSKLGLAETRAEDFAPNVG